MKFQINFYLAGLLFAASATAYAEMGVSTKTILIGRTAGITGSVATSALEAGEGAQAYFDLVNSQGGIHGRQIKLLTLDDKYDPATALVNAEKLIRNEKVFALFLTRGTAQNEAILPALLEGNVPLVAPSTGASIFHAPVNKLVFNVRAKYQTEVTKGVEYFLQMGGRKVGLLHVDDAYGEDAKAGFKQSMLNSNMATNLIARFDSTKPNVAAIAATVMQWDASGIILASTGKKTIEIIKAIRAKGCHSQIMVLSNNSSEAFSKDLGAAGIGVVVSQITPPPHILNSIMGSEFSASTKKTGFNNSYASMEGFIAAKILVEGLRRAGPNLTRPGFISALESVKKFNIGSIQFDYSPRDHTGSEYVDMTIIGKSGRLIN